ncbi:uncharacterized protein ARMOST_21610 [Armillaria ostoyae]|uniref:Uncharacterized protein n=1 Tax=Armillaria ostoyae TaxID=47428 RepID=A0A284SAP6_ARMOS|nr:uncharacterized protein ARMOST_21610 [Armillaria ostoyae]
MPICDTPSRFSAFALRVPVTLAISNELDGLDLACLLVSSDDAATSLKETSYLSDRAPHTECGTRSCKYLFITCQSERLVFRGREASASDGVYMKRAALKVVVLMLVLDVSTRGRFHGCTQRYSALWSSVHHTDFRCGDLTFTHNWRRTPAFLPGTAVEQLLLKNCGPNLTPVFGRQLQVGSVKALNVRSYAETAARIFAPRS